MKIDANKLRIALARKCWMWKDLQEQSGVTGQTFRNIKAGLSVKPETAGKIARALGVDVTELLTDF